MELNAYIEQKHDEHLNDLYELLRIPSVSAQSPRFFRAPAGLRSPLLDPLLQRAGLQLASWTRRGFDTVRGDPDTVFRKLTRGLRAGDILLLHDGGAAQTARGVPVILEVLPRLLDRCAAASLACITLRSSVSHPLEVQAAERQR